MRAFRMDDGRPSYWAAPRTTIASTERRSSWWPTSQIRYEARPPETTGPTGRVPAGPPPGGGAVAVPVAEPPEPVAPAPAAAAAAPPAPPPDNRATPAARLWLSGDAACGATVTVTRKI